MIKAIFDNDGTKLFRSGSGLANQARTTKETRAWSNNKNLRFIWITGNHESSFNARSIVSARRICSAKLFNWLLNRSKLVNFTFHVHPHFDCALPVHQSPTASDSRERSFQNRWNVEKSKNSNAERIVILVKWYFALLFSIYGNFRSDYVGAVLCLQHGNSKPEPRNWYVFATCESRTIWFNLEEMIQFFVDRRVASSHATIISFVFGSRFRELNL